ncbi:hypothetical protein Cgig2_007370 [Carnegiea gigantea]|uniref:Uncharacterized protein n=1 Tax=Carnegiea gigantea TaxID=171969 RepID=A0A9Q1QRI0_9CARY|nr:hypothetical protein Cgig2_007370 [Carnegiea gigantea]
MALAVSLQFSPSLGVCRNQERSKQFKDQEIRDSRRQLHHHLLQSCDALKGSPLVEKLVPAVGIIIFALLGLGPLVRISRNLFLHKTDSSWRKSTASYVMTSYLQPVLLWTGAALICRALDTIAMPTAASELVKQRLLTFVKSLSTVLALAYCLSSILYDQLMMNYSGSVIHQAQKYFMETNDPTDTRNMGFQFAGRAIYTAVWVAAVSLFMELLGFSTQKWLTAGGLGTVLLTLAGREIFTNFLSSVMIHATRPFVVNEWIQAKIDGSDVSGTVENIVADMRKVLAKHPLVEQQKLHRRVFLENINPENQALQILISCFVKTSRFEEYLCVKEVILLDLLRVVRHHRARLATPIRTIQKLYDDTELGSTSFSETIFTRGGFASRRQLILIEPSYKPNGEDKSKSPAHAVHANGQQDSQRVGLPAEPNATNIKVRGTSMPESDAKAEDKATVKLITESNFGLESNASDLMPSDMKASNSTVNRNPETNGINGKSRGRADGLQSKQTGKSPVSEPPLTPTLEENIVLGVALEGSKRTLPIEELDSPPTPEEKKEPATRRNGNRNSAAEKGEK